MNDRMKKKWGTQNKAPRTLRKRGKKRRSRKENTNHSRK